MIFILVWSTLAVLSSAADEKVEDILLSSLSKSLTDDTNRAAAELATSWVTDKDNDQESVVKFLDQVANKVISQVQPVLVNLVKSALGEAAAKAPEKTPMFRTLHDIIKSQARVLTLGKAKLLKTNDAVDISNGKGTDSKISKIFQTLFKQMKNRDVKEADKDKLIQEAQINIDAVVNQTISSAAKSKDQLASRSGNFFFNSNYQQQQQQHSSSLAQKLTHHLMTDVISNPPVTWQSNYVQNPCGNPCSNPCGNPCSSPCGHSGLVSQGEVFQQHQGHQSSGHHTNTGVLCGGGFSSTGTGLSGSMLTNTFSSAGTGHSGSSLTNTFSSTGTGLGGSSLTNTFGTGNVGQYGSSSAYSGSNFGSNSGYSGSSYGTNSAYSGSSFNSQHDSSLSKSISASGTSGSGVKGYYAGNANLWYLGDKSEDSAPGSSFGGYGSSSHGGSSLYGTNTLGTSNSIFNSQGGSSNLYSQGTAQHSLGTAVNVGRNSFGSSIDSSVGRHVINSGGGIVQHGLGTATGIGSDMNGVGYGQQGSHYSVSNSQSSQSDRSHNHMSYSNSNNMW